MDVSKHTHDSVISIFFILLVFLISHSACTRKKQSPANFDSKSPTVVAANGYKVPGDKILPPVVIPVKKVNAIPLGKPDIALLESNIYPATKKTILPAGKPKKIIPGQDGFKLPIKIPVTV